MSLSTIGAHNQKTDIEEDENDFDVVIIGAGLSGLTAAKRLISAGLNVLLIEKEEFSGGRLLSAEHSKSYYAHESQYNIGRIIRQLKLAKKSEKFPDIRKLIYCKSTTLANGVPFYVAGEIHYFIKIMDTVSRNNILGNLSETTDVTKLSDLSVEDLLNNFVFLAKSRSICRILVYITCGTLQLKQISALWYLRMLSGAGGFLRRLRVNLGDGDRYFIKGGAMRLAQVLANKIEGEDRIHYREEVRKVQFSDDRAHVWSTTNHYKCDYVIFTVPFTEDCRIIIEPGFPTCVKQTQTESRNIFFNATCGQSHEFTNGVKNIISHSGLDENFTLIYDATCFEDRKLTFSGFSSEIEINTSAVINALNKYSDCRISGFDEWTTCKKRSMNVFQPKTWSNSCWLLQNFGRIVFAGSEYATQWAGTIDGAIESGEYAAFSILQLSRPQSMERSDWFFYKYKRLFLLS